MTLMVLETGRLSSVVREPGWVDDQSRDISAILLEGEPVKVDPLITEWIGRQPVPVIAMDSSGMVDCVDLLVTPEQLDAVLQAIDHRPAAAAVCCQVSRMTGELSVSSALRVESLAYASLQGGAEFASWLSANRANRPGEKSYAAPEPVSITREGGRLAATLCRPENRNALSAEMRDALTSLFRLVAMDETIESLSIDAEGPDFCSGGALDEFGVTADTAEAHRIRQLRMPAASLAAVAGKVEFHLHGKCVGAGIELPAFGGRVTALPGTSFRLPEVGMGLIPGAGGCVSIPRRIGRQRFNLLAITGAELDLEEAFSWGLVDVIL